MNADSIYRKYWNALDEASDAGPMFPAAAVRLALHLAIADAYDVGCEQAQQPDQRVHERLQSQINRLNEWLADCSPAHYRAATDTATAILDVINDLQAVIAELKELPDNEDLDSARRELTTLIAERDGLRQQLAQMDSDNAGLTRRCTGLEFDVMQQRDALQAEIDRLTRENTIAVDAFNSLSAPAPATNGNGASQAATPTGTWWTGLDDETNDWRVSIEAGRRTFRQLNKQTRLALVQAFARHVGNGLLPTQAAFDAARPAWMPGGSGLVTTFGCNWAELLTVQSFEVIP
jgi:hypothetical protein